MSRAPVLGLILASKNAHKAAELAELLGEKAVLKSIPKETTMPEVVEDAPTFEGNALKKAETIAGWLRETPAVLSAIRGGSQVLDWAVLADDSGLEVDALGGAPGIHSARYAALDTGKPGNSPDAENNAKLQRLIAPIADEKLTARFRCVLALVPLPPGVTPPHPMVFDGRCEGRILKSARGASGFGYDPYFAPAGFDLTFAELGPEVKNKFSHRAQAAAALKAWLLGQTG